jgi:hypothetical protein
MRFNRDLPDDGPARTSPYLGARFMLLLLPCRPCRFVAAGGAPRNKILTLCYDVVSRKAQHLNTHFWQGLGELILELARCHTCPPRSF